jgi:uncharacterized membrane protein YebE (DUF533 family)
MYDFYALLIYLASRANNNPQRHVRRVYLKDYALQLFVSAEIEENLKCSGN